MYVKPFVALLIFSLLLINPCSSRKHGKAKGGGGGGGGGGDHLGGAKDRGRYNFDNPPGVRSNVGRNVTKTIPSFDRPTGNLHSEFVKGKICIGTNGRLSVPSNKDHHYRNLRDRYTNCTYVDGNLEITWLQNGHYDLSFLQYIREVTGYVLISHIDIKKVVLPRLQIIRGRTLFKVNTEIEEYSLFVTYSQMYNLELPALRDIINGSVGMHNNFNLCHIKTIKWDEIISSPISHYRYLYNFTSPERTCPPCDSSCEAGCWGEGPENCQRFSKMNCSPQCSPGRCFGPNPRECCHAYCAGGCTGPKQSHCLACKNFYDDGVCTDECPSMQKYNPTTYSWEPNPNGKYAYGATCVRKCPEHLLKDNGACVRSCPPKKRAHNGECIPCEGPCPKTCPGVSEVNSGNINSFKDCTIIEGSITILDQTFKGYQNVLPNFTFAERFDPMHPDKLEVFSSLKEITGYLNIQGDHPEFTNLSYFRNLETIGGRTLTEYFASLYIVKTSLVSLELNSLKLIQSGSIIILENKNLCYASTVKWEKIRKSPEHENLLSNNKNETECIKQGLMCDEQCSAEGCWGKGSHQCLSCKNFKLANVCIKDCNVPGIYEVDDKTCQPCHDECDGICNGPTSEHCTVCKHVRDGPFCVAECPMSKYNDNGQCKSCHKNCVGGCDGPENNIGSNGCHSCEKAIVSDKNLFEGCLPKEESCPDGHYSEWVSPSEEGDVKAQAGRTVCRKCHTFCKKCTGFGFHEQVCQECVKYKHGENCAEDCPAEHYIDPINQNCMPCDQECRGGCRGPGSNQCMKCRNYKVFLDGADPNDNTTMAFNCTEICPEDYPFMEHSKLGETYCSAHHTNASEVDSQFSYIVISSISFIFFIMFAPIAWYTYHWLRSSINKKEEMMKMTRAFTGLDDNEPLQPTGAMPNLAKLRIIKEEDLRKGGILGMGAFGNVYTGVWVPEGENNKIPVAIKVLHENSGVSSSKEFLDEAYIMASMEHPNLLQLLAVCMTSQIMLVTQLMPLGTLLDFVRNNKDKIGSKLLLNWCGQIANGMAYLEERRLVHRDLAARNVLVQNNKCVKITDFGLAKLLDEGENEYKAGGGKMPIKWLALECIQHRMFTHKSDVWAFGVTIWEVLTFGGRPYENLHARDVPELLEKGERLKQPPICSLELYMVMVKCWMIEAKDRPSFKELMDEFGRMSQDPARFLVVPGDKLLKLQVEKDMMRHLSNASDGNMTVADEEYLQPKSRAPLPPNLLSNSNSGSSPPSTPIKTSWPNGTSLSTDSPTPQNQQNWDRELLRNYNASLMRGASLVNGTSGASTSHDRTGSMQRSMHYGYPKNQYPSSIAGSDLSSSRYCSDPLKIVGIRDCDVTDDGFVPEAAIHQQAHIGGVKLDLPIDEDDYLMPSAQPTTAKTHYIDIIAEANHADNKPKRINGYRQYPVEFLTIPGKTSLDNPEYIMSQDDGGPLTPQPLGIPTTPNPMDKILTNGAFGGITGLGQRNSGEESDHEYYNDFDHRLERELQPLKPLRKNETTV